MKQIIAKTTLMFIILLSLNCQKGNDPKTLSFEQQRAFDSSWIVALQYGQNENYDQAIKIIDDLIGIEPNKGELYFWRGAFKNQRYSHSQSFFKFLYSDGCDDIRSAVTLGFSDRGLQFVIDRCNKKN